MHIAHLINPVRVSDKSELFYAQPITFQSMLEAKRFSKTPEDIGFFTTQFEEDKSIIPKEFQQLSNLSRSILDVQPYLKGKKLPLIKDIFEKIEEINAEFIIFTNVDIALMPQFYDFIITKIEDGHDAIVINRRRISSHYREIKELPEMYADLGKSHPGFDCFVFKKTLVSNFILDEICVGISFLEASLTHNIFSFAKKPLFVPDGHLTFHIGMEVLVPRNNEYYRHNRNSFFKNIYPNLKPHFDILKFPYASLPMPKRALKWMLNPSLFTRNYLNLEGKRYTQKVKIWLDEIRWRILQK